LRRSRPATRCRALARLQPDAVVVDDDVATVAGLAPLVDTLRAELPDVRTLLLAARVDSAVAAQTLAAGMDGVVLKSSRGHQVVRAVEDVLSGVGIFPAGWLSAAQCEEPPLSERKLEVLELVARGLPNQVIARELFISPNTVKFHVAANYQRLGVHNRVEAASAARQLPPRRAA
jgi:two-component system, NarL family, response regulator DesR